MAVWGSSSFWMTLTAPCALLWIQWTSPTWQWYSIRFDSHLNGARLLGTKNHFLAIRDIHLNTKQHVSNVHYTFLQPSLLLQAGWPRCQSSSPGRVKNFLSSKFPRQPLASTEPIQWVLAAPSRVKMARKWSWPLASSYWLHSTAFNSLNMGITVPFTLYNRYSKQSLATYVLLKPHLMFPRLRLFLTLC
jgi:hypothetical protein